jgi:hypothetical protein
MNKYTLSLTDLGYSKCCTNVKELWQNEAERALCLNLEGLSCILDSTSSLGNI